MNTSLPGRKRQDVAACHGFVSGRVQGIFFRASAKSEAAACGVCGWIQNLPDGRVEFFAQGQRGSVELFLSWCRRGPALARIESVDVEWVAPVPGLAGFVLRRYFPGMLQAVRNLAFQRRE